MKMMTLTLPLITVEGKDPSISPQDIGTGEAVFIKNNSNGGVYVACRRFGSSHVEFTELPYLAKIKSDPTVKQTAEEKNTSLQSEVSRLKEEILARDYRIRELELLLNDKKKEKPVPLRERLLHKLVEDTDITDINEESFAQIERILDWEKRSRESVSGNGIQEAEIRKPDYSKDKLTKCLSKNTCDNLRQKGILLVEDLVEKWDCVLADLGRANYKSRYEVCLLLLSYWSDMYELNINKKTGE